MLGQDGARGLDLNVLLPCMWPTYLNHCLLGCALAGNRTWNEGRDSSSDILICVPVNVSSSILTSLPNACPPRMSFVYGWYLIFKNAKAGVPLNRDGGTLWKTAIQYSGLRHGLAQWPKRGVAGEVTGEATVWEVVSFRSKLMIKGRLSKQRSSDAYSDGSAATIKPSKKLEWAFLWRPNPQFWLLLAVWLGTLTSSTSKNEENKRSYMIGAKIAELY